MQKKKLARYLWNPRDPKLYVKRFQCSEHYVQSVVVRLMLIVHIFTRLYRVLSDILYILLDQMDTEFNINIDNIDQYRWKLYSVISVL